MRTAAFGVSRAAWVVASLTATDASVAAVAASPAVARAKPAAAVASQAAVVASPAAAAASLVAVVTEGRLWLRHAGARASESLSRGESRLRSCDAGELLSCVVGELLSCGGGELLNCVVGELPSCGRHILTPSLCHIVVLQVALKDLERTFVKCGVCRILHTIKQIGTVGSAVLPGMVAWPRIEVIAQSERPPVHHVKEAR